MAARLGEGSGPAFAGARRAAVGPPNRNLEDRDAVAMDHTHSRRNLSRDRQESGETAPRGLARRSLLGGAGALLGAAPALAAGSAAASERPSAGSGRTVSDDAGEMTEHRRLYYRLARF